LIAGPARTMGRRSTSKSKGRASHARPPLHSVL
jgi:hypothetical protein